MATSPTQAPVRNIFKNPLSRGQNPAEKLKKERTANKRKSFIYLGVAFILLMVYSISFLYPQTMKYLESPAELQALNTEISTYENTVLPALKETSDLKKVAYDAELLDVEAGIDKVFPPEVDKLGIVKRLENFATALNTQNPPFEFDSMSFSAPVVSGGYTILPISTTIHSSRANFDRFVELVNLSGKLDTDIPIRLMEISNINIRYRGVDPRTGQDQGVDFTVKLNAYSRSS